MNACNFDKCEEKTSGKYCRNHSRQGKMIDENKSRGLETCIVKNCNSPVETIRIGNQRCNDCMLHNKNYRVSKFCNAQSCDKKTTAQSGYCKTHEKEFFALQCEQEELKICSRNGCKEIIQDDNFKQCSKCREQGRKQYIGEKQNHEALVVNNKDSDKTFCTVCHVAFPKFINNINKESTKCMPCLEKQRSIEVLRVRDRDYSEYDRMRANDINRIRWKEEYNKKFNPGRLYRARQILKYGLTGYRRRRADAMTKYRNENPEYFEQVNIDRNNNGNYKFTNYKYHAKQKNINFSLSKDEFIKFLNDECFYCNKTRAFGIDKIDCTLGYTIDNCVACCGTCNNMKNSLDVNTFIMRCKYIAHVQNNIDINVDYSIFYDYKDKITYSQYIYKAKKRNIDFELTETNFKEIINDDCYICGKQNSDVHQNGIDRYENDIGYNVENSIGCCGECNYMKKNLDFDIFINQIENIYNNCFKNNEIKDDKRRHVHTPQIKSITNHLNKMSIKEYQEFKDNKVKIRDDEMHKKYGDLDKITKECHKRN